MKSKAILFASFGIVASLTAFSIDARAADEEDEPGVIYQKKTIVSFEDDMIDGDLTRPDGAYVESRKRVRHSNLIKIREDFRDKILNAVTKI